MSPRPFRFLKFQNKKNLTICGVDLETRENFVFVNVIHQLKKLDINDLKGKKCWKNNSVRNFLVFRLPSSCLIPFFHVSHDEYEFLTFYEAAEKFRIHKIMEMTFNYVEASCTRLKQKPRLIHNSFLLLFLQ